MATILVIDDNADLLQMMRVILGGRGKHEVILSADGADGLSRALSSPPDLAIIDVMMPGITGYDIVRRLREQPQTAEMPILILTARGQMIDRQTALQAGADDHMAKPVTPQALLEKVNELLALHEPPPLPASDGGKVVSLLSLRGGVGVTTLAVNLALSGLQAGGGASSSCLVDLSPSSGQAALHLRVKAQKNWAALSGLGPDLSPNTLADLLTPHPSGLQLLAAPFEPTFANTISAPLVDRVLTILKSNFSLVVVDTPSLINVVTAATLDASDHIILVLTPEVGAIQATVATLQVTEEVQDKLAIVLNRVSPQPGVPEATVERALHRPLTFSIPYDPAQTAAFPQGKPLAWAQPSSPLAAAMGQLIAVLNQRS